MRIIFKHSLVTNSKIALLVLLVICTVLSCQKTGDDIPTGPASVSLNISEISFEKDNTSENGNKSTSKKVSRNIESNNINGLIQTSTVKLNDDYYVTAVLEPELPVASANSKLAAAGKKAATESGNMDKDIKYKVIVYDDKGNYVAEKEYIRGKENLSSNFLLDGGKTYTFIIYSLNSKTKELPKIINSSKTLATSQISVEGDADFLYAKIEKKVVGGAAINKINVTLKHQFSEITASFDATATGSNIVDFTNFIVKPHSAISTIKLSDGSNTRSASIDRALNKISDFQGFGTPIATTIPFIINSATNSVTSFVMENFVIAGLSKKSKLTFSNFAITPGTKYNLKIKINLAKDAEIVIKNVDAVNIAGQIWMRRNLGVASSVNPDTDRTSKAHGHYYQWGENIRCAVGTDTKPNPSLWISDLNIVMSLNSGWLFPNAKLPEKRLADPCPDGFRVPTALEFQTLINNTISSNIGTWDGSSYTAAKVLTSKTDNNIKLTFPMQGLMFPKKTASGSFAKSSDVQPFPFGEIFFRGSQTFLFTNTIDFEGGFLNKPVMSVVIMGEDNVGISKYNLANVQYNRNSGRVIRCIAD